MARGAFWTTAEREAVRELVSLGYSREEVAEEVSERFGTARTPHAVECLMSREGWRSAIKGSPDAASRSVVIALIGSGASQRQVAERLGVTNQTVAASVKRMVRDGLLVPARTGRGRYAPSPKWLRDEGGADDALD